MCKKAVDYVDAWVLGNGIASDAPMLKSLVEFFDEALKDARREALVDVEILAQDLDTVFSSWPGAFWEWRATEKFRGTIETKALRRAWSWARRITGRPL